MPWARIDDGFDDHPKVLELLEHDDGAAAIGLWLLCLTWAHRNTRRKGKTPGRLPSSLPRRYLGVPGRDAAKLLVAAGLWEPAEDGWNIHDFDGYLPTEKTSEARRAAGKKGAAARWGNRGHGTARDCTKPSGNGKPPSPVMACDDSIMAGDDSDQAAQPPAGHLDPDRRPGTDPDGTEPSGDGNLLCRLPHGDGKPVAADSSRAPARRAISSEIAPGPEPGIPPSAGAAPPRRSRPAAGKAERQRHTGEVVAAYVDGARNAGLRDPSASLRARVGKQARELLGENWPIDLLIGSARRLGATEFNDLAVQVRKDEAAARQARNTSPPAARSTSTGEDRARAASMAGREVQALIDEGRFTP